MRLVPLTQGYVAQVDDEDYALVSAYSWSVARTGGLTYAKRGAPKGQQTLMHRIIMGFTGPQPEVDHVDGNGLNNQRSNLRIATATQNHANMKSRRQAKPKSSRFKGVSWCNRDRRWIAIVQSGGKRVYVGYFKDEIVAAHAYDDNARQAFGEFARTNFSSDLRGRDVERGDLSSRTA